MEENMWNCSVHSMMSMMLPLMTPPQMNQPHNDEYKTKWVTLDKSLVSAVDFIKLGVIKPKERIPINFKKGEKYVLKGKECDGFKMREEVYEVYGTSDKMDETDDIALNSVIVKEITPHRGTLHTLSKNDCEWLGIEFENGLQLMPKSLDWKPYEAEVEFDPNDLSTTHTFNSTRTISHVLLKVNGFQSCHNSMILTPNGRVIRETDFKNSLVVKNNIPLVYLNTKMEDIGSKLRYEVSIIEGERYSRSNILTDDNSLYLLVSFETFIIDAQDTIGIDKDYLKGISPSDFFSVSWDEFGAYTLEEYEAKLEEERKERERKVAEEEAKLKRMREAEERARKEREIAEREKEKKLKDTVNKCINSLCGVSVSLPFGSIACDDIMDISIPTSIRIESVDGIIDTISSSMDSLNGILDNCLETIDSINIPQISSVDFKNLINRNVI